MSKNTGTLISAAIRPNDSLDPIASAYAYEIKGGLHTAASLTDRNSIIFERREWGMMCYVTNLDKTYQLKYGYVSSDIMDNSNWVEFSGSGGSGGSGNQEWINSVISINNIPPVSPSNGDRYLLGPLPTGSWSSLTASVVLEWNSTTTTWSQTIPTEGMSVVVDNEDNAIYKYVGVFPGGSWMKEKLNQIRTLYATTVNGYDYTSTSIPVFSNYTTDLVFFTKFDTANTGVTVSININGLGQVELRKPTSTGIGNLQVQDILPDIVYNLIYDGTYFQINRPHVNDELFNVKNYIESTDYIIVPQYYQYWVYSDLEIAGTLVNYGQVVIANGTLTLSGGVFSNFGELVFVNFNVGLTSSFNSSDTIYFTQSNTVYGLSVSATVIDGSLTQSKLSIDNPGIASDGYVLGWTSSGDFIWIDSNSFVPEAGDGLIVNGTTFSVNTGLGLTISNDSVGVIWGGTTSGLTFSNNSLKIDVDGSTVFINSNGQLSALAGSAVPVYQSKISNITTGDGQFTGLTLSFNPSDYSRVQVFVNGMVQTLGDGTSSSVDCYFYDGSIALNLNNLSIGNQLYWNYSSSGFNLNNDLILVVYES